MVGKSPIRNKQIPRFGLTVIDQQGDFVQIEAQHGTYIAFTGDFLRLAFMSDCIEPIGLHYATPIASTALTFTLSRRQLLDKMLLQDHGFLRLQEGAAHVHFQRYIHHRLPHVSSNHTLDAARKGLSNVLWDCECAVVRAGFLQNSSVQDVRPRCVGAGAGDQAVRIWEEQSALRFLRDLQQAMEVLQQLQRARLPRDGVCHHAEGVRGQTQQDHAVERRQGDQVQSRPLGLRYLHLPKLAHAMPMPNGTHNFIVYSTEQEVFVP
ncbi:hypothetical protein GOP47_0023324 [Adiantum capillus-veneris]|uniref:Uncharacterized protein n=1 Tax=Adiantum capillus-veneris TaxID=13818 RepID=A0A9D4Z6E7_ADICA|nr:hypothetical protein GOP47_0023324 [Adiantum capillus-veneris]